MEEAMNYGKRVWIFPDAELPPAGVNLIPGHESIIITNVTEQEAMIQVTFLYTDKAPLENILIKVGAKRVRCVRTNSEQDFGSCTAKVGEQYAIMLESNTPIIAQYGRAEPRAVNFYTTPGYCE
jgi:hypothetical protein